MQHAKLSPSASGRWLNCAGSIALNAGEDGGNFYADEGTAAHALLEMCHRLDVEPAVFLGTAMYKGHIVTDEMAAAVGHALDYCASYTAKHKGTQLIIEREVDPHHLLKCEPGYASGTPDLVLDNARDLELVVIDYKHGAGIPVEVSNNTQILQYIVGYFAQYLTRPYKRYRAVIVQPRTRHEDGPVREHVYTHAEILAHANTLKKRIIEIKKRPDQREAGDWCKWCRGAATCATLKAKVQQVAQLEFKDKPVSGGKQPKDPKGLKPDELGDIMKFADVIEHWLKEVRAAVLLHLQRGGKMKDWKLVRGRQGNRYFADEAKVQAMCAKLGLKPDQYAPRSLLGVPGIEKLLKQEKDMKELPATLAKYVKRGEAPLHVARKDDPRPTVTRGEEFVGK